MVLRILQSLFSGSKSRIGPAKKKVDVAARFQILREGVAGTMSRFYVAMDRERGEIVGLKILDPQKTAAYEARFKGLNKPCEGEIAMRFVHPYIVMTYEYGWTTRDKPYLVMEYLEGGGLNGHLVAKSPFLFKKELLPYIRQVAEALAVVHEGGFIHRDVCPRNLMFNRDFSILKLTDFGLSVPATPPFMQPGNRSGTPNYMAPELVRRYPTDQRLDVFSFGVSMYEMLTFELPWERGTTGLAALQHEKPPADIRRFRPQIHPDLAEAIHACIEPVKEKRCPSMRHFLEMIEHLQSTDL